jgi:pimeloyl-ACP methyl ester carboxylesterase
MKRTSIDGIELAYELRGAGEPIVLVHWGVSATWAEPLLGAAALSAGYRLLNYHRAGFGASGRLDGPISIAAHTEHCRALMHGVGIERAHVVGHSSSAAIALQLALDHADAVHTLTLMDAARPAPQTETQAAFARSFAQPAIARYRAGDVPAAVDTFLRGVFGPDYRPVLERGLPGAFEQAIADAPAFFEQELPALYQWSFDERDARRVTQPVLLVLGERSGATFAERRELLLAWLPNAEPFDLPGASHMLHVENPDGLAQALAGFVARQAAVAR